MKFFYSFLFFVLLSTLLLFCKKSDNPRTPTLTTSNVISITQTSCQSGGDITSDGGSLIISKGVCWNTTSSPTTSNSKTVDGSGTGTFSSNITGLNNNTTYYVRAYATNNIGTAYGNEITFKTTATTLPTITTTTISGISQTSASSGGNITFDGGSSITAKGICWSTTQNPTIVNSKTVDSSGTGSFTSNLLNLNANTTYYVRAYATNSVGTSYGSQLTFTTTRFSIGQNYGGGIIFYIDGTGQHGLIASTFEQRVLWATNIANTNATDTAIGTGKTNTSKIISILGNGNNNAASICASYRGGGYSDWFFPSRNEILELCSVVQKSANRDAIRNLFGINGNVTYWTSSELKDVLYNVKAHSISFSAGGNYTIVPSASNKSESLTLKFIRAF
jgi:hypothetical protein